MISHWIDNRQEVHWIDDWQVVHWTNDRNAAKVHWIYQNGVQTHHSILARGPLHEEMIYEIPNLNGFTQDSGIR